MRKTRIKGRGRAESKRAEAFRSTGTRGGRSKWSQQFMKTDYQKDDKRDGQES
jgi:hypothetical protein